MKKWFAWYPVLVTNLPCDSRRKLCWLKHVERDKEYWGTYFPIGTAERLNEMYKLEAKMRASLQPRAPKIKSSSKIITIDYWRIRK